jgi:hypothetical protein
MRALLRKDAAWLIAFAVGGLLIGLLVMAGSGAELWFLPKQDFGPGALVFHWLASSLLGLWAGTIEELTRTREYLWHRPVSTARLFWIRQLGCALVLLTWIVVAPALHLVGTVLFDQDTALVEADRLWTFLDQGLVGVAFYGMGLFVAALVRRPLLAIVVATPVSLALLLLFGLSLYRPSPSLFVVHAQGAMAVGLGLVLVAAAQRLEGEGRDLDRPLSRLRMTAATAALVLVSLGVSAFLHIMQLDARRGIHRGYPKIARLPGGAPVLVAASDRGLSWRVDEYNRRVDGPVEDAQLVFAARGPLPLAVPAQPFAQEGTLSRGVRYQQVNCGVPARCFLGSDGLLHVYGFAVDDAPSTIKHVGKETGDRFSTRAQVLGRWGRSAFIADPEDGGVWVYDFEGHRTGFTRIPLPGGDRFVEDLTELLRSPALASGELFTPRLLVRGERALYLTDDSEFRPAPPALERAAARLEAWRQLAPPQVEVDGPVTLRVTLPASAGGPAFSHRYVPRTVAAKALHFQMQAVSLLRAPLLALTSAGVRLSPVPLGNPTDGDARILLDPVVMLGGTGILVVNLLLGLGLAALAWRRLGQLGAPAPRRGFWTATVFLFGIAGYVLYRTCENRRAWQPLEVAERRPLLIQSAA